MEFPFRENRNILSVLSKKFLSVVKGCQKLPHLMIDNDDSQSQITEKGNQIKG